MRDSIEVRDSKKPQENCTKYSGPISLLAGKEKLVLRAWYNRLEAINQISVRDEILLIA